MKKSAAKGLTITPTAPVEQRIFLIRGRAVMLSHDLASIYGAETRALIQAVKRNIPRFPADFMFQLTPEEHQNLKSQIVTSSWGGARRAAPCAFTELGVAMLSSVLKSETAIQINIEIMRAFVRMKKALIADKELARRFNRGRLKGRRA